MVAAVRAGDVADVTTALEAAGETVFQVGEIGEGTRGCTVKGSQGTWSAKTVWSATHEG
jgi:phosphoribosylformylglycinamidine cyclo-ligase